MDSDLALVLFLGLCLLGLAMVWLLILFTPIASWILVGGVAYLGIKLVSTLVGTAGAPPDRPRLSPEKLISQNSIQLATEVGQAGPERFVINARGTISNRSDRMLAAISIWCRAEALHGSETGSGSIRVIVRPGETQSFSGEVADRFSGIAGRGTTLRVAPRQHFCRVERLVEG